MTTSLDNISTFWGSVRSLQSCYSASFIPSRTNFRFIRSIVKCGWEQARYSHMPCALNGHNLHIHFLFFLKLNSENSLQSVWRESFCLFCSFLRMHATLKCVPLHLSLFKVAFLSSWSHPVLQRSCWCLLDLYVQKCIRNNLGWYENTDSWYTCTSWIELKNVSPENTFHTNHALINRWDRWPYYLPEVACVFSV